MPVNSLAYAHIEALRVLSLSITSHTNHSLLKKQKRFLKPLAGAVNPGGDFLVGYRRVTAVGFEAAKLQLQLGAAQPVD